LAPSANQPVELSFDYLSELIIIEAEGVKGKFLFDNEFTLTAISPEFIEFKVNKVDVFAKVYFGSSKNVELLSKYH